MSETNEEYGKSESIAEIIQEFAEKLYMYHGISVKTLSFDEHDLYKVRLELNLKSVKFTKTKDDPKHFTMATSSGYVQIKEEK